MQKTIRLIGLIGLIAALSCGMVYGADHATDVKALLSSATYSGAGASSGFNVEAYTEAQILVEVTAESGASTLDIIIETSPDNATWYTHTTIAQITAIGKVRQAITNFGKYVRVSYTVGGTSFTYSITGVFKN